MLVDSFNFDVNTVNEVILNALRFSFLPLEEKQAMEVAFRDEMERLQRDVLCHSL
jgi:hypothetical protein